MSKVSNFHGLLSLVWARGATGSIMCAVDLCPTPNALSEPNPARPAGIVKDGIVQVVQARIDTGAPDPGRAHNLSVTMEDSETKLLSARLMNAQLQAAAEAAYAKQAVPSAAPKL